MRKLGKTIPYGEAQESLDETNPEKPTIKHVDSLTAKQEGLHTLETLTAATSEVSQSFFDQEAVPEEPALSDTDPGAPAPKFDTIAPPDWTAGIQDIRRKYNQTTSTEDRKPSDTLDDIPAPGSVSRPPQVKDLLNSPTHKKNSESLSGPIGAMVQRAQEIVGEGFKVTYNADGDIDQTSEIGKMTTAWKIPSLEKLQEIAQSIDKKEVQPKADGYIFIQKLGVNINVATIAIYPNTTLVDVEEAANNIFKTLLKEV